MSTSTRRKRAYHHGDLRAALVRSASELLEKHGVAGLSLRETAGRAGVSHGAPYRHFSDRGALLAAVAAEGFARLGEALAEGARSGSREMGEAYVRFALAHPQRFRLMFGGQLRFERHPELRAASSRAYEGLIASFRAHPAIADPALAASAAWSLVHGLANLLLDGHFEGAKGPGGAGAFVHDVLGAIRFAGAVQRAA